MIENWNYKKPDMFALASQDDWNQTLVTAFNCVVNENNMSHKSKIETIVPNKFKSIIESLAFYDDNVIGEKYVVKFIEDSSNKISLEGCDLEILNYDNN